MSRLFWDEEEGGWFHTASDAERLVARMKTPSDASIPGGNAEALRAVVRLATMTGDRDLRDRADRVVRLFHGAMERFPGATTGLLLALDMMLHDDGEIAFVGDPGAEATRSLIRPVHAAFLPGTVLALLDPRDAARASAMIPLLEGKTLVDGAEAAYVCRNFACRAPVTSASELEKALAGL
jgi:uncharacterized protein YyaL (SSP411 family)